MRPRNRQSLGWVSVLTLVCGCATSSHPTVRSTLGAAASSADMESLLNTPGPIRFERIVAADWVINRSGLINLDHPKAEAAGLQNGDEAIQLYFYVLRHPEHGTFLVDSGVERATARDTDDRAVGSIVALGLNLDALTVHTDTRSWVEANGSPVAGVLISHMHIDHVWGISDIPRGTPLYTGPGEAAASSLQNMFTQATVNRLFAGHDPVQEWVFQSDAAGRFDGLLDVLGDQSLWALHVPGHTPGSTAYLARTTAGPVLMVGDACHTRWGWENRVEPGSFSADGETNARTLGALIDLAERHPNMQVHLGHQTLGDQGKLVPMPAAR